MTLSWEWCVAGAFVLVLLSALRRKPSRRLDGTRPPTVTTQISFDGGAGLSNAPLPDVVQQLIKSGNKIGAIKELRKATGMDLTDAHSAVSNWQSNDGSVRMTQSVQVFTSGDLPPEIMELLKQGKTIEAVRRLRQEAGMKTGDAKRAVEAATALSSSPSASSSAADFNSPEANPIVRER